MASGCPFVPGSCCLRLAFLGGRKGKVGDLLVGHFKLVNAGDAPLAFRLEHTCGCAYLKLPKGLVEGKPQGTIEPGGKELIEVGVRLQEEKQYSVTVRVFANDPQLPQVEFRFFATCPSSMYVEPQYVDFGKVAPRGPVLTKTIRVLDADKKPWRETNRFELLVSSDCLTAAWEGADKDPGVLVLRLDPSFGGQFQGSVRLFLQGEPKREYIIPVLAYAVGPVTCAPTSLSLVDRGDASRPATFVVRAENAQLLANLQVVKAPRWLRTREVKAGDNYRRFEVELNREIEETETSGVIELQIPESTDNLVVEVSRSKG